MRKLLYEERVQLEIRKYIFRYKKYFHDLYSDTGIFSEQIILEQYEKEGNARHREILNRIQERLSLDTVYGRTSDNTLLIPWRSKTLWFTWQDEGDTRIVTDLIIR